MHLRCRTGPSVQQGAATLLDLPMLGACVVSAGIEGVLADLIEARAEEVYPRDVFVPPTSDDLAEVNALLQRERGHQLDGIAAECYRRAYASIATQIRDGEIDITAALREHLLSDEVVERATRAADKAERQAFIDGARGQALIAVGTRAALSAVLEEDR